MSSLIQTVLMVMLVALLSSCVSDDVEREKQVAIDACVNSGGVPIMSRFAHVLVDCKYPTR